MRTETTVRTIYSFAELSDDAKERARDWYRQGEAETFSDYALDDDDFENVARILGIEFAKARHGNRPAIYWSGFWSQGDGASWEGSYRYAKGAPAAIRAYAPTDTKLHRIADGLAALQRRNFYSLEAEVSQSGRYVHEMTMHLQIDRRDGRAVPEQDEEDLAELLRDVARWIYRRLEAEYDDRMSDESIDEMIGANEYEFDVDGNVA